MNYDELSWESAIRKANSRMQAGFVADECYRQTGKEYSPEDIDYIRSF